MNSNINDCSIENIVNIVQVGYWVIGISVLPEKIWSDQAIFENVFFFFFFYIKTTLNFFHTYFKFFSPSDLKCLLKEDPLSQCQNKNIETVLKSTHSSHTPNKVKIKSAFRYISYIKQSGSDQNKINVFWRSGSKLRTQGEQLRL